MSKHQPHIESVGLPTERHADRVVAEMLRYIAAEHAGAYRKVLKLIAKRRAGGPKAQQRLCNEIMRVGGPILIEVQLEPGTRGRYTLGIIDWCPWDPARDAEIKPGDPIPEKPWLACNTCLVKGRVIGRGPKPRLDDGYVLFITHHALSRLAQRADVRTVAEMIAATRAIWFGYAEYRKTMTAGDPTPDGKHVEVVLPDGTVVNAVLATADGGGVVVKTIKDKEMY